MGLRRTKAYKHLLLSHGYHFPPIRSQRLGAFLFVPSLSVNKNVSLSVQPSDSFVLLAVGYSHNVSRELQVHNSCVKEEVGQLLEDPLLS